MDLQEVGCGYVDWIGLAQDRDRWRTLVSTVMNLRVPWNAGSFLTSCKPVSFSRRTLHHGVSKYCIFWGSIHWFLNYYLAPEGQTDIMLVLIGPKQGWERYMNRQICNNCSEVLGNLLVQFIIIMLPFTPFSSRLSPSFSKPRWCA